jgi:hypothetical protein
MTTQAIVMKERRQRQKYPHNTQIFFYRLDQENMLEIVNLAGYEVTYRSGRGKDNSISGMLLATGEFVQCGYQSHMALFPLLKTARVASGENSCSMLYLYLLTYLLAIWPSQSFSERNITANSQLDEAAHENAQDTY